MEHKWTAISAIFASVVSALAAIATTYFSNANSFELETLKLESKSLEMKREHFIERCESMNQLLKKMSIVMPTLYMTDTAEEIFDKVAVLKSDSLIARSYLSDESYEVFEERLKELIAQDYDSGKERIERVELASIHALSIELQSCNKPDAYPG